MGSSGRKRTGVGCGDSREAGHGKRPNARAQATADGTLECDASPKTPPGSSPATGRLRGGANSLNGHPNGSHDPHPLLVPVDCLNLRSRIYMASTPTLTSQPAAGGKEEREMGSCQILSKTQLRMDHHAEHLRQQEVGSAR